MLEESRRGKWLVASDQEPKAKSQAASN